MEHKKNEMRGIPLNQERLWAYSIQKEDKLRLKWFKKNEERLDEIANKVFQRKVPDEVKEECKKLAMSNTEIEHKRAVVKEPEPPIVEEEALYKIMRPVPKEVRDLLYSSTMKDGRQKYLRERYQILPEKRYYFPETTNFRYGWNMWGLAKNSGGSPFARKQVIRESFYRRRGVKRDPEWYKEPARLSPQVLCGTI